MTVKGGTSQACAACKYQRRRCSSDCPLAPYFPASQPKVFLNAHRLFGVCNIMKILKQMNTQEQKDEAMKSIKFESDMREKFPVHGCCGIICRLHYQLIQCVEELQYIHARLAICREEYQSQQIVDHSLINSPSSELQLGMNPTANALVFQHNLMPFEPNNNFVMNANNHNHSHNNKNINFNVESNVDDHFVRSLWIQPPNNNDSIAVQSHQLVPSQAFPVQQETEVVDYDDMPFDTMADDRQSFIESREPCESSCESPWKAAIAQPPEHVSSNELKSAAARLSLTSVK